MENWFWKLLFGGFLFFEHWLSKTDLVEAGSTIELIGNAIKSLIPTAPSTPPELVVNIELKNLIDMAFDSHDVIMDLMTRKQFSNIVVNKVLKLGTKDFPSVYHSWPFLKGEMEGLKDPAKEMDLVIYIQNKFSSEEPNNEKAKEILAALLKLVMDLAQDGLAFRAAIIT